MNADGIYEYSDEELAGYLSPGESTYRIQAGLLDLVIKAAHVEMPNTAVIKSQTRILRQGHPDVGGNVSQAAARLSGTMRQDVTRAQVAGRKDGG